MWMIAVVRVSRDLLLAILAAALLEVGTPAGVTHMQVAAVVLVVLVAAGIFDILMRYRHDRRNSDATQGRELPPIA